MLARMSLLALPRLCLVVSAALRPCVCGQAVLILWNDRPTALKIQELRPEYPFRFQHLDFAVEPGLEARS